MCRSGGRAAERTRVPLMSRITVKGLVLLSLAAMLPEEAAASVEFRDIPYLQARIGQVLEGEATGAEVEWFNEATGNSGVIRVLRTYFPKPDSPCRDYERVTRQAGGADVVVRGTGCRDSSGRWRLQEEDSTAAAPEVQRTPSEATPPLATGEKAGEPVSLVPDSERAAPPPPPKPAPAPKSAASETATEEAKKPAGGADDDVLIVMPTRSE